MRKRVRWRDRTIDQEQRDREREREREGERERERQREKDTETGRAWPFSIRDCFQSSLYPNGRRFRIHFETPGPAFNQSPLITMGFLYFLLCDQWCQLIY